MNNRNQNTARVQAPAPAETSSLTYLNVFTSEVNVRRRECPAIFAASGVARTHDRRRST